ncbi:hypothetical protein [Reichenbachiella ulvae]|uniref:Outer membrane protein beta-barrel domain-containing protein n=1 Tax=Reichenbachiella ulvae TaxID=2980104 RepID=A0ABT3CRV5_9BACT|nr:hypothetical protein [Reichenbachiella ulvae]MCV9386412.1 hypothetical protein [Reichenbachiella ulvae]
MKSSCLLIATLWFLNFSLQAQSSDTTIFPYVLPVWGQKVQERGMADQLQLPFGLNVNYVNAFVDMEITEFQLLVGGSDLTGILNTETLNFTQVGATTNGLNLRADAWILPFVNVYGLFSSVKGGTNVSLQPTWKNSLGEIILQLPEFSSEVEFDAIAYGAGTTWIFGWNGYFLSTDINYSRTDTELLKEQVGYMTLSARAGYRFFLNKNNRDLFIAPYMGMMHRNFVGARGSSGTIGLDEVFPELDNTFNNRVDTRLNSNQEMIDDPNTSIGDRIKLEAQNTALREIQSRVNESGFFTTEIDYFIEKELIQTVTFQFGFNFQINKNWMLRGEYGVADSQRFLMTGLQYRFGVKKKGI